MKSNEKQIEEIRIPELKIPAAWKRLMEWVNHVRHFYWIFSFFLILILVTKVLPFRIWSELWSGILVNRSLVSMLLVFCLVAVSLAWSVGQKVDVWVFLFFNMRGHRPQWLDFLMLGITQMGNFFFALALSFVLYLKESRFLAYELILGVVVLGLLVEIIKVSIRRIRPYIKLRNIRIVGGRDGGRSFPSGHTAQAFFLASMLVQYYHMSPSGGIVMYLAALMVGITRIYVGMHYPRDVLGGAILGTAWGIIGAMVNGYITSPH